MENNNNNKLTIKTTSYFNNNNNNKNKDTEKVPLPSEGEFEQVWGDRLDPKVLTLFLFVSTLLPEEKIIKKNSSEIWCLLKIQMLTSI